MNNPQPPYPQGNFQQTPPAKSNKKLWIILGLLIGVPTVLMGGCVACMALLGLSAANNPNLANVNATSSSTSTPQASSMSNSNSRSNSNASSSSTPASTPASTAGVTMANYNRLKTGMTYPQVVQILGKEGTELSRNDMAGYETIMYQWEGDSFASNMNAMFQNGKLMQKAQFGLK
jgi:hypothetical protein